MTSRQFRTPAPASVDADLRRFWFTAGVRIHDARVARKLSVAVLAEKAGVSRWVVYLTERGEATSLESLTRIARALGLRLDVDFVDATRREARPTRQRDLVHAAMGEALARHLRPLGFPLALDEPYQHFQFAGRADVTAWDIERRSLLHIENRSRFPDLQEMAGSYNAKRAYLGEALAARLGVRRWFSETHVVAALWSAEVLHAIRLHPESFRALFPEAPTAFDAWWAGSAPSVGRTSALVVFDPAATAKEPRYVGLELSLLPATRPRYRNYAHAAVLLQRPEAA